MLDWSELRDARLLITGGTGFLGAGLLEAFAEANRVHSLSARAVVLTRNPDAFRAREPRLAKDPAIELYAGDVRFFGDPGRPFTHVIHGAAESERWDSAQTPAIVDTICRGTLRVLEVARHSGVHKLLFLSSGAVYGPQPPSLPLLPEDYCESSSPPDALSAYGEAKRTAELLCVRSGIAATIARCFAFLGPRMPLDGPFAAGNFVRDVLAGANIEIRGDGTGVRSYLYAGDCAEWLWTVLLRGAPGEAYNVGSDQPVTIAELARRVAACAPRPTSVRMQGHPTSGVSHRYVPCIRKAQTTLGLRIRTPLDEAIRLSLERLSPGS